MDKELLKQRVNAAIDEAAAKIKDLADRIYAEPEMGYKEVKTAAKVAAFMKDELGLDPQTGLAINGVKVNGHDILEEPELAKKCIGYLPYLFQYHHRHN